MNKILGLSHATGVSYIDLDKVAGATMETYKEHGVKAHRISIKFQQGAIEMFMRSEKSMNRQFNLFLGAWGAVKGEEI